VKRGVQVAACCGIVAAAMAAGLSADTSPSTYQLPSNSEVIGYLLQSVNWYRHVYAERQVANEPAASEVLLCLLLSEKKHAGFQAILTRSYRCRAGKSLEEPD
jgi:hypothetical protein